MLIFSHAVHLVSTMVFVAPIMTDEETEFMIMIILVMVQFKPRRFLKIMNFLLKNRLFRTRIASPQIDSSRRFNRSLDDGIARVLYRFTILSFQSW